MMQVAITNSNTAKYDENDTNGVGNPWFDKNALVLNSAMALMTTGNVNAENAGVNGNLTNLINLKYTKKVIIMANITNPHTIK